MMTPVLYTLTSGLHGEMARDARQEPFIREIEAALGESFDCRGEDFSGYGTTAGPELIYIRTGGTEGLFRKQFPDPAPDKAFLLLASAQSNSLAASMEILSWLQQRGIPGEILHGSPGQIAARLNALAGAKSPVSHPEATKTDGPGANTAFLHPARTLGRLLAGQRFGVIGKPSDWLISSDVDYAAAREILGAELVDIPIEELVAEAEKGRWELPEGLSLNALNAPRYGRKLDEKDWRGALAIYGALKRLVARYRLDGLTLRCFDLLDALHNTGCLALAILNTEGITVTCEGDIPAMLSMAVVRKRTGSASFQVNLSRIEGDRLLFAHCTVPLSLVRSYCYDTHFESGIGVGIHGELPEGPVTLFKLSADLSTMACIEARLTENPYGDLLCRTQVVVQAPGAAGYFLRTPLGNHHILFPGKL